MIQEFSVNVYRYILVNVEYKLVMLVGNCIVSNMAFNLMDKCQQNVRWVRLMIHFKHFLLRLALENVSKSTRKWSEICWLLMLCRCTSNGFYWFGTDCYWWDWIWKEIECVSFVLNRRSTNWYLSSIISSWNIDLWQRRCSE